MVEISAFRALRYTASWADSLATVVAPPYDVIGAAELKRLWDRSPYNVVRLILPAGDLPPAQRERGHSLAAERLRAWKRMGVLAADPQPSLYLYEQQFRLAGELKIRRGFFALARLTEWGEGIYRHELTLPGPVSDRIHLLAACQANLSSIFGLYSDPQQEIISALRLAAGSSSPAAEATDDRGVSHRLWVICDQGTIRRVAALMRTRAVVVADGHHRYTAALEYRNQQRAAHSTSTSKGTAPWDYVLFYFDAFEDPGLVILPTHQVVHGLAGFAPQEFIARIRTDMVVRELPSLAALAEGLADAGDARTVALGAILAGSGYYLLETGRPSLPQRPEEGLDVSVLRHRLIEPLLQRHGANADLEGHLWYTHEMEEAASWVERGQAQVAFILRPTPLEQVRSVALAQRVMPQKSTYFYPKVLSGLVIYDHTQWESQENPLPQETAPAT